MVSTDNELNAEYRLYCLNVGNLFTEFARLENLLTSALKLHLAFNIGSPEDVSAMRLCQRNLRIDALQSIAGHYQAAF